MVNRTIRIPGRFGGDILIVRWPGTRHYRAGEAASVLRDACERNSSSADDIIALASGRGYGHRHSIDEAIQIVAEMIESRELVLLEMEQEFAQGAASSLSAGASAALDWDNLRRLSDLRETDPTVTFGSLSIELLDHTGIPFRNQELKLRHGDGGVDRIVLDEQGKWSTRSIAKSGTCKLVLPARLELTPEQLAGGGPDGFRTMAGDLRVKRVESGELSLPGYDAHYRIVVEPPARQATRSFPITSFASESAFPTPAIANLVTYAHELLDPDPAARIGLFGHTDTTDDADANKLLADRRADVAFALLTGDYPLFAAVAQAEDWPLAHYQVMLRVLGCNPTAIDGESGVQTDLAIAAFRDDYNADAWHDEGRARAHGDLPPGTALDAATKLAIVDAYHAELAGRISPDRLLGPKRAGCGEFNPLGAKHGDNRRVTLAIYGQDAPTERDFPCRAGDASACQIDDAGQAGQPGGSFRCKFYRERIHEEHVSSEAIPFWDFEWLKTESGKAHLSALTHLPDTNEAEFVVSLVEDGEQPPDDGVGAVPARGLEVGRIAGLVRGGVIYALWTPPEGYDPFIMENWFRAPSEVEARPWQPRFRPPVFGVAAHGQWGFGAAPGHRRDRIRFAVEPQWPIVVLCNDGKLRLVPSLEALRQLDSLHVNGIAHRPAK